MNLNTDKKWFWLGEIESIDSMIMNDSMPIPLIHFNINKIHRLLFEQIRCFLI